MDYEKVNSFIHESKGKTEFKVSEIIKISHILKLNKKRTRLHFLTGC